MSESMSTTSRMLCGPMLLLACRCVSFICIHRRRYRCAGVTNCTTRQLFARGQLTCLAVSAMSMAMRLAVQATSCTVFF